MLRPSLARSARVGLALAAALSLSCAAPAELARRSESAHAAGNDRQAWEWAERAMKADPDLPRARAAITAAAVPIVADWQARIRGLAAADTVAAGRLSLEFGEVRARLGGWGIPVPLDSTFLDDQSRIRHAAAARLYERGVELQRAHRPREAYRSFAAAGEIVPGFRDVDERAHRSFELGVARIAVVPFEDDTGVPGLAEDLAGRVQRQLAGNMPQKKYPFVRFVAAEEVANRVLAEGRITREVAIRIGRSVGANRVVWGRLHGLHSDTRTDRWRTRVYRKVTERDREGGSRVRYFEVEFETVSRERDVRVDWDFEVIETDDETALATRSGTEQVTARSVFTRFDPGKDCDDYSFAPPEWKSERSDSWQDAERDWKVRYGDWSVPDFLEAAVAAGGRHYRRSNLEAFVHASRPPVVDALPPAGDLAFLALREVASPVWDALKALEREPAQ